MRYLKEVLRLKDEELNEERAARASRELEYQKAFQEQEGAFREQLRKLSRRATQDLGNLERAVQQEREKRLQAEHFSNILATRILDYIVRRDNDGDSEVRRTLQIYEQNQLGIYHQGTASTNHEENENETE